MIVLGVDVATRITGWCIYENQEVVYGIIDASKIDPMEYRLKHLYDELCLIVDKYEPDIIGVEDQFFGRNVKTLKGLSQARGIVMLVASQYDIPLVVVTPKEAKLVITGSGGANKNQVREAVKAKFDIDTIKEDEADAIGIAYFVVKQQQSNKEATS